MGLRIRKHTGEVSDVVTNCVIEVTDSNGDLGVVVIQRGGGSISVLTPGDPLFNAHLIVTKQKASKVEVHEPVAPVKGSPFGLAKR